MAKAAPCACKGKWPGAKKLPRVEKVIRKLVKGKVRARCNSREGICVAEFDRTPEALRNQVREAIKREGYLIVSDSSDHAGSSEYASEVRFKRPIF